jgi:thioredoxin 1
MENINQANFEEKTSEGYVVVDMYADWCGPCRAMSPVLEEFNSKNPYRVQVFKVDVEQEHEIAERFNVSSIPCMIVMKDGVELDRIVGALPLKFFDEAVRKIITQK